MTLLQLKYISTVAKCGSFSKAAQVLYVSQPGISKMVCALEEELGITIFVRSAAGITLTAEGRELLNMGERLLTDAEHISQHFSQDLSKTHETLSVSSQHYCFVIDAMMAYQNTYQKESYTYKFLVGQGPEVIQQVVDKTTELGVLFISSRSRKHMNRVFGDNNLEFHPLFDSKPYVFIHKSHPLASKEVLTIEELHPYPCIMYELDSDAPSVLQEEMLVPDFYPQKVTFIGKFEAPATEQGPTPEEILLMEKRQKIREKRHEAYLRRKSTGWQATYYWKNKRARKEKMDAAKEAIRAEDQAKGIYYHPKQRKEQKDEEELIAVDA